MECAPKYDACEYRRREPEQEILHQVLCEHLETFLDRVSSTGFGLPRHVEKELRDYLECGVLAYGFVRISCNDCGKSMAVGYSCKGRGFCPSCTGRRMADTSARLFGIFAEVCAHCGGKMRIVAAITDPSSIKRYLDGVGLPSEIPEIKPARPPPQMEIEYEEDQLPF